MVLRILDKISVPITQDMQQGVITNLKISYKETREFSAIRGLHQRSIKALKLIVLFIRICVYMRFINGKVLVDHLRDWVNAKCERCREAL